MCWTDILYDQMAPDWRGLSGGCRQEMRRASEIAVAVEMVGGAAERRNVSEVKVERVGA